MAIKNKDGSYYKLSGPNPHMKNQLLWDHFELHNMDFKEVNDLINKKNLPKKDFIKEDLPEEDLTKEDLREKDIPKEDLPEENLPKEDLPKIKKITIYCLPATTEVHEDVLYGEIRKTIKYDKKFKFEAILISNNDINFQVWTNAVDLGNGSILYPQNFEKRWWKVTNTSKKFDGFLLSCSPSNITPSFEDL